MLGAIGAHDDNTGVVARKRLRLLTNRPLKNDSPGANKQRKTSRRLWMDKGRKRVLGIMAAILPSDDLFGGLQGSPRTEKLVEASIHWAEKIIEEG